MSLPMVESLYKGEVSKQLRENLQVKIPPRIVKVVLNMGVGKAVSNKKHLEVAFEVMKMISGQHPIQTKARRSESGFGIRAGWPIGCKATLRRKNMYGFLDRLLHVVIPRIPDFSGLNPNSFDGQGNYTMGMADCVAFPECDIEQERVGLDITIVTSACKAERAYLLLSLLGFPFRKKQ
jgi:large subunit ribosomal protein L5